MDDARLPRRIWVKLDRSGDCWLWTGSCSAGGYGKTTYQGKYVYLHRLVYSLLVAPIEARAEVDHLCHVKRCCRPEHLRVINHLGNTQNRKGAQRNSRSGVRNVFWEGHVKKWRVQMRVAGRNHNGGLFDSIEEADAAAKALRARLMPENST